MPGWIPNRHQAKYAVLLLALVMTLLMPHSAPRKEFFDGFMILVLAASVIAIGRDRKRMATSIVFALLPLASAVMPASSAAQAATQVKMQAAFLFYATLMILSDVFQARDINRDKLLGSICAYFLVGLLFGLIYIGIELSQPGSFRGPDGPVGLRHDDLSTGLEDFGFFSMITLTTVGYGDISPVSSLARSVSVLEAVFGQFYFALMVGRLLALYLRDNPPE